MLEALFVAVVLLGLLFVGTSVVLCLIMKQQGRMLLHLDDVERRLGVVGTQPPALPLGTLIQPFHLLDVTGQVRTLEEFLGKRVLLTHWDPSCGFCDLIAPDLARLQADFQKHNVQLILISDGDAEPNRKLARQHGLACPIFLQQVSDALQAFQHVGTPAAYLLDEQGRVAQPLAVGAYQVPALAREAVKRTRLPGEKPLSESRIERDGLKVGTPAPSFRLPDVYGRSVSLEEYRGRPVLLVFTDSHCGPCDQIAPHLVRLHRQLRDDSLTLVMVGRGAPEENRRKAEEHGFEFPVVVQRHWELSKEYGIFATPSAFLISGDGIIARNVARGSSEILVLVQEWLATEKERSYEQLVR